MTLNELQSDLDLALVNLNRNKQKADKLISEGASVSTVIANVYDSVFKCLQDFGQAVIDYESHKD